MQSPPRSPIATGKRKSPPPIPGKNNKRRKYYSDNPLAMPNETKASKNLDSYYDRDSVFPLSPKCPPGPNKKKPSFLLPKDTIDPRTLFSMFNDDDDDDDDDDEDLSVDEIMHLMVFPF